MSNRYPRSMYKGSYTEHAINADHQIAHDETREAELRDDGFVDGHEFFTRGTVTPEVEMLAEQLPGEPELSDDASVTEPTPSAPKRRGRKAKNVAAQTASDNAKPATDIEID
jgi:hypothetical protein